MNLKPLSKISQDTLKNKFNEIEKLLGADVLVISSGILDGIETIVKELIRDLNNDSSGDKDKLYVILTTNGGSITPVQKMVEVFRHYYREVIFIVPDYAYSAGTILCMSGDEIIMSYYSNLGPIDPQVKTKDGKFVSALGYLDKINEMISKAQNKTLTDAEFLILRDFDLAEIRSYEMQKELATDVLKDWLTKYKFKNWNKHSDGTPVTNEEKLTRAEEIATKLGDNKRWKSHGRPIVKSVLENELKLKIKDMDSIDGLTLVIEDYYNFMTNYMSDNNFTSFFQTRLFI